MTVILLASLLLANGARAANFDLSEETARIYSDCSKINSRAVADFENKNGFSFSEAIFNELKKYPQKKDKGNSPTSAHVCGQLFGETYGRIKFKSKPVGASIFIDGDRQPGTTNATFAYPPSKYQYRIEPQNHSPCEGTIVVEEDKIVELSCP
jgi:hypothetical protein